MGKINVLDEHIANQIAAGEVVERPSSVVKELVENAIDAGSTEIDISLEEGGLQLIRVSDNGSGMETDDCEKAFYRHATSKIAAGGDLFKIRSLGFRGEALPSIAAVAKVECLTSAGTNGLGSNIVIEGGQVKSFGDATAPQGTVITVRDLFFNTPARLKYMKTIQTELGHVSDYIYRLSLAHPSIAFKLRHQGNLLVQTIGNGDVQQVIAAIYGTAVGKSMLSVNGESLDYQLSGYISRPETTRSNRAAITTIVNGRYIRNYALAHAVLQAYHTLLPINRYPVCVISVEMDPTLVDVNVHPSKLEVRFSKEAELLQFIQESLKSVLHKQVLIPLSTKGASSKPAVVQEQFNLYRAADELPLPPNPVSDRRAVSPPDSRPLYSESAASSSPRSPGFPSVPKQEYKPAKSGFAATELLRGSQTEAKPELPAFPELYPIGQTHGTYILAQNEDGLFIIDQHAAHERIHYEYYYDKFGAPSEESQELLLPITLEFTPSEAEMLKNQLLLFSQVGVHLEHFGGNTFRVLSYPHWIPEGEEKEIVEQIAEWILEQKRSVDIGKLREKSAILCSCKASIKANSRLTLAEMEALLDRLSRCANPYTCPHGRPILIRFSTYDLEKMFKRVM